MYNHKKERGDDMKKFTVLILTLTLVLSALSFTGCSKQFITLDGEMENVSYEVGEDFYGVKIEGLNIFNKNFVSESMVTKVHFVASEVKSVSVYMPSSFKNYLNVESKDGVLTFSSDGNNAYIAEHSVDITVSGYALGGAEVIGAAELYFAEGTLVSPIVALNVNGAGKIEAEGVICNTANLIINGAANVVLKGEADRIDTLSLIGACSFDGSSFSAKTCNLTLSGANSCILNVSDKISGNVEGATAVNYKGDPDISELTADGVSSIKKID